MTEIMMNLRKNPPKNLGGLSIIGVKDLLGVANLSPESYSIGGSNDIISFELLDDSRSRITIRPSGTEPKLKIYIQRYEPVLASLQQTKRIIDDNVNYIIQDISSYLLEGLSLELMPSWNTSLKRII